MVPHDQAKYKVKQNYFQMNRNIWQLNLFKLSDLYFHLHEHIIYCVKPALSEQEDTHISLPIPSLSFLRAVHKNTSMKDTVKH